MSQAPDPELAAMRVQLQLARLREEADIEQAAKLAPPPPALAPVGRLGMVRKRTRLRAALNLSALSAGAVGLLWLAEGLLRFLGVH